MSRAQRQSRKTIIGYTEIWVTMAGGGEEGESLEILKISLLGWEMVLGLKCTSCLHKDLSLDTLPQPHKPGVGQGVRSSSL